MGDPTTNQLLALVFIIVSVAFFFVFRIRFRGKVPPARSFPIFETLSDQVGRAAEEGNTIHIALGQGSLLSENALVSLVSLQSLRALMDLSAAYDTPPLITTGDSTLFLLASDRLRRAYARIGDAGLYRTGLVQFTTNSPLSYAALAATYLLDGRIQSNIMLGAFNQEVSLLSEAAYRRGISTDAGMVTPLSLGALYPALSKEHLVMGEDLFAGAGAVKEGPGHWAGLWTQDILRLGIVVGVIVFALLSLLS